MLNEEETEILCNNVLPYIIFHIFWSYFLKVFWKFEQIEGFTDLKSSVLAGTCGDYLVQLPCSKQGHLQWVAQGHVHLGLKYLQVRQLHNLSR